LYLATNLTYTNREPYYGDIVAQYLGFDDFQSLGMRISTRGGVLPKMLVERFIGNETVEQKGVRADKYKRAGYRLYFEDPSNKFSKN
jgi:hypothetical protein